MEVSEHTTRLLAALGHRLDLTWVDGLLFAGILHGVREYPGKSCFRKVVGLTSLEVSFG
jgi:hypothetical protein